jgi:hypothetical protein
VELQDEARLGLDEVRVLIALRQRIDGHLVAAHLARDRFQVLSGRDHLERGGNGLAGREHGGEKCQPNVFLHHAVLLLT